MEIGVGNGVGASRPVDPGPVPRFDREAARRKARRKAERQARRRNR